MWRRIAKNKQAKAKSRGVAFVELALISPFLILLTIGGWDTFIGLVAKLNQRKAAIVIAKDFPQSPLIARYVLSPQGNPEVQISRLSLAEAISSSPTGGFSQGFLPGLVSAFDFQLDHAGSGAKFFDSHSVVELRYLSICENLSDPACTASGKKVGAALADYPVENDDGTASAFRQPGGDKCFGEELDQAIEDFKTFRENITSQLLSYDGSDFRLGLLLIDVDTGHPALGRITEYSPWRPVVFWMQCSRPPFIFRSKPVITTGVFFPDAEANYVG